MIREVKIVIKGGLGNQMFQYAFARAQSLTHNASLVLDTSWYNGNRTYNYPYALDKFNIVHNEAVSTHWEKRVEKRVDYDISLLRPTINGSVSYSGYFQDADYFRNYRNVLLEEFTLKNVPYEDALYFERVLQGRPSVFVHVRRGERTDGVAKQKHGLVSKAFYVRGMQMMRKWFKDPQFICFTDARDWVATNMKEEIFDFVVDSSAFSDYETMHFMSKCDHAIIPNSCFSWWGAWLIPNMKKTIIAASRWSVDSKYTNCDICPQEWVRIDPEFEK